MAMKTDTRRFVNFLLLVCGMAGMVYLFFVRGVWGELEEKSTEYTKAYEEFEPLYVSNPPKVRKLDDVHSEYAETNEKLTARLKKTMDQIQIAFSPYCTFPADVEARKWYGDHFYRSHSKVREDLQRLCRAEGARPRVQLDDDQLGLGMDELGRANLTAEKAVEMLRELSIAEKIIKLLIQSYKDQYAGELAKGEKERAAAFLQIVRVVPEEAVPTGAVKFRKNPDFEKDKTNPRIEPFAVQRYREFIREYPVEITVVCDLNTLIRFLHSVRKQDQFLVLRKLQIMGQGVEKSMEGSGDLALTIDLKPDAKADPKKGKKVDLELDRERQERLRVLITAAGMVFVSDVKSTAADRRVLRLQRGARPTPLGM